VEGAIELVGSVADAGQKAAALPPVSTTPTVETDMSVSRP
jgi:hypothetical protein